MFKRNRSADLAALLTNDSRDVIVVEGARQVGKTTLIEDLLERQHPQSVKINLETNLIACNEIDRTRSFDDFALYLANQFGFKDQPGSVLFIDEAQESQTLGRYVRSFKEQWKHARVILTGSSMSRLFREDQRIPVGRYTNLLITPLTFAEFLSATGKEALVDLLLNFRERPSEDLITESAHRFLLEEVNNYFTVGGLPAVVSHFIAGQNWRNIRRDILLSQAEDFIRKSELKDKFTVIAALKGVANNLGSASKFTQLNEKYNIAKQLASILRSWKLVFEVAQRGSMATSSFFPKRYLYDIGIAQDLRELPFPEISLLRTLSSALRTPLGGLMENALLLQLLSDSSVHSISGWRNSSDENKELDFVVRSGDIWPIECKSSLKLSTKHFYGIREYLKVSGLRSGYLVSLAPFKVLDEGQSKLINLPFYLAQSETFRSLIK